MVDFRAPPHVRRFYPDAIKASVFVEAFLWFARRNLGVGEHQIALLSSVCSDDLNSVELPATDMVGPFILGGLDGYPFVGKTGLRAFSHHIPENGAALLFFGPHVGITNAGELGKVVRPGQSAPSDCCGAAMAGLKKLAAGSIRKKPRAAYAEDDYQQETLEQLLLANAAEILLPGRPDDGLQFFRTAEVIYREMKQALADLLKGVAFERPAFVLGGIVINEDHGASSDIEIRHAIRIENGQVHELTREFKERAAARFDELRAGKIDAFRQTEDRD